MNKKYVLLCEIDEDESEEAVRKLDPKNAQAILDLLRDFPLMDIYRSRLVGIVGDQPFGESMGVGGIMIEFLFDTRAEANQAKKKIKAELSKVKFKIIPW